MRNNSIWKKFEKSGSITDYLEYACTACEDDSEMAVTDEYADGVYADSLIDEEINDAAMEYDGYDRIRL